MACAFGGDKVKGRFRIVRPGDGGLAQARARQRVGIAAIGLAIAFNVPYGLLAATFDYPAILKMPAGGVLERFAAAWN